MKKHTFLAILGAMFMAASSQAAVIISLSGNPNTGPAFFLSNGTSVVPDGSLIRLGTFDVVPTASTSFTTAAASFREFGTTTMGNTTNVNTGHVVRAGITGGTGTSSPDADSFFVGKQIYLWVYNSTTADTGVDQGIFATTLNYADQATALTTSMTGYTTAAGTGSPGTASSVTTNAGLATKFVLGSNVPEPSAAVFSFLGLALVGLRRNRKN